MIEGEYIEDVERDNIQREEMMDMGMNGYGDMGIDRT